MAIECFEIKWTGPYSLDTVQSRIEARDKGVYAVHKAREIFYIGKSSEFGKRLADHRREWKHALGEKGVSRLRVYTGVIHHYKSTHPSQDITSKQTANVESFLINLIKPEGNPPSDKRGYKGLMSPIIVNTGKALLLNKVLFHNTSIEKLLKGNLTPKRRQTSTYGY
jgi:predicted GIY-YIG superfamily endonuclease